jgi:hypothetical protein
VMGIFQLYSFFMFDNTLQSVPANPANARGCYPI